MGIEIPLQVTERLAKEQVIWLTTTKADGTPLPNPVWFLWDGGQFLIFTEPGSVKMKNMVRSPYVALNLNSDADGGDVAIFQAEADLTRTTASEAEFSAYVAKYEEGMRKIGLTQEVLVSGNHVVRLTPVRYRTAP
jgi:PPOX class probable F420-dependent enzyme